MKNVLNGKIIEVKIWKVIFVMFLLFSIKASGATPKILIARNENWSHPVESVFKKYNIYLYKVHYSKDGTCPTFYAKFKYSPNTKESQLIDFPKVYNEILIANSNYPYALVDKENNIKINVGWKDKHKKTMVVDIDKAASHTTCKGNSHAHIDDTPDFDKFKISAKMKRNILTSSLKVSLRRKDGRKFVAYLYAEDEQSKPDKEYLRDGRIKKIISNFGHYYIYLYDINSDSFFPGRMEVFSDNFKNILNTTSVNFFSLSSVDKNKSDVLFISQPYGFENNHYEAYGFNENQSFLKKYMFITTENSKQFYGKIFKDIKTGELFAYDESKTKQKMYLVFSDTPGEIQVKLNPGTTKDSKKK